MSANTGRETLFASQLAETVRLRFWTCHRMHHPDHPNPVPVHSCRDCKTVNGAEEALVELVLRSERLEAALIYKGVPVEGVQLIAEGKLHPTVLLPFTEDDVKQAQS